MMCLHAFLTLTAEEALFRANRADFFFQQARHGDDQPLHPLLGIPIAIKDVLALSGVRCTCGSRILENYIPPFTATAVDKLLEAGVIVLGKTNTDEFAMGSSTENSAYGPTHNPWNLERAPGGSSGGSAAAVAARMAFGALGTDTGGSVRQPASFCGVTGLKTSYGRVSRYGLIAYGSSLDTVGCFARSVEDTALLFSAMAGFDPRDATSQDVPVPNIDLAGCTGPQRFKDRRSGRVFYRRNSARSGTGCPRRLSQNLEGWGRKCYPSACRTRNMRCRSITSSLRQKPAPTWPVTTVCALAIITPCPAYIDQFKVTRGEGFGPEVKRRIMLGTYALSAGYYDAFYGQAQKVRTLIKRDFDQVFEQVDAIAAPVAPTTAFKLGEHTGDPLAMYLEDVFTLPANLAGVPGIAFPVGFDDQRLPIGMQLMGRSFQEDVILRMAHAYQQVTTWHQVQSLSS